MNKKYRVFISSTTADLESYREAVAKILCEEKGLEAIHEGAFPTMDYQAIRRHLWERIQISDAVLFLIGFHFGGEPRHNSQEIVRRSFSQMEWDFAQQLAKPCYVLFAGENCPFDNAGQTAEPEDRRTLQQQFRTRVRDARADGFWHEFGTRDEMEQIVRNIDFPTRAPKHPRKPCVLPYSTLGEHFAGRETELATLRSRFATAQASPASIPAQTIQGLGGIGKTRLAVEYACAFQDEYAAVLFLSAETPDIFAANLSRLARPEALGLSDPDEEDERRQRELVLGWLESETNWLLIIDNVDTTDAAAAVRALLPRLMQGHVLITSRLADWVEGVQPFTLGTLSAEASIAYLIKKCSIRRVTPEDSETVVALARNLGGLALALEQASAFINLHGLSFHGYQERWQREDTSVREWFNEDLMRYPRSVATTWETSFAELGDEARVLLRLLCWLSTEPVPRGFFRTDTVAGLVQARLGKSRVKLLPAAKELSDYSLIRVCGNDAVQIHQLVQEVTRARLPALVERRTWLVDCLGMVNAFAEGNPHHPTTWPIWEPLRPHILVLADWAEKEDISQPMGTLLNQLSILLLRKAAYVEAKTCLQRALRLGAVSFGQESLEVAAIETNLGTVSERLDQFSEAEKHYMAALTHLRQRNMGESTNAADVLGNLGALYVGMNRFDDASVVIEQAMKIERQLLPADSPQHAPNLSNHGMLLLQAGKYAQAETAYREALAIVLAKYGEQYPEVATMRSNLGLLLQKLGRLDEAEECFRFALAADTATYGFDHPAVGRDANNLALLLRVRGKLGEAEQLLRDALKKDHALFGDQHSEVADGYSNLGLVLIDLGRNDEAVEALSRALACAEALHGNSHLRIADICLNLGCAVNAQDKQAEALGFVYRTLAIQSEKLGDDHPDVALTLNNLAQILKQDYCQLAQARTVLLRAMKIDRKAFGRRHSRLGPRLTNLAWIYWSEGRLARAEQLYRAALTADRALYGNEHPEIAVDINNLAGLLRARKDTMKADAALREAASIALKFIGPDSESADPRLMLIIEKWETRQNEVRIEKSE